MAYGITQSMRLTRASSEYANVADNASLSVTGDLTIEFWIKIKSQIATNGNWELVCKSTAGASNRSYEVDYLDTLGSKTLRLLIFPASTLTNFYFNTISKTLTVDTWEHIAVTVDVSATNKCTWYFDGVSAGNGSNNVIGSGATSIYDGNQPFAIGQSSPPTAGLYPDAQFSLVRLWAEARTGANITDNICNVLGATTNLRGEWTLDNTYADNSGNGNTLSGVNTPTFVSDVPSVCGAVVNTTDFFAMM